MNNSVPFDKIEVGVIWILAFWTIGKKPVFVVDYFPNTSQLDIKNQRLFSGGSTQMGEEHLRQRVKLSYCQHWWALDCCI